MAVAVEVLRAADVMLEARQGWNTAISLPNKKSKGFRIGTWALDPFLRSLSRVHSTL
jgi:hypothetical protein